MDPTDILRSEHRVIEQVLACLEKMLVGCMSGERLHKASARAALGFLRNFADHYHHAKEEGLLFPAMAPQGATHWAEPIEAVTREHDQCRALVRAMDESLAAASLGDAQATAQFVEHGKTYIRLLREHIRNEDHCLFALASEAIDAQAQAELTTAMEKIVSEKPGDKPYRVYLTLANHLADRLGVTRLGMDSAGLHGPCNCWLYAELAKQKAIVEQQHRMLTRQLELARQVQQALIRRDPLAVRGLQIAWQYEPVERVGGDLLDVIRLADERVLLFVGDAMGHGVPAALLMCMVKTALQSAVMSSASPSGVLAHVNGLTAGFFEDRFVTGVCCLIDSAKRHASFAMAGHSAPLYLQGISGDVTQKGLPGLPLGLAEGHQYEETTIALARGDVLLFYTDGIVEACDPEGRVYGPARLATQFRRRGRCHARRMLAHIRRDLGRHCNGQSPDDDLTLLAVRVA